MANQELADKRAQALHLTRRASHKISRLKTKVDVIVGGSEYDPRKSSKLVQRYTSKQLDAYIARVSQFNARSTQFVPDAHKRPIPASEFKEYKQAEQRHHARVQQQLDKIKNIKLPGRPETIGQRRDQRRADRKMAGNPSTNDPYAPPVRDSKQVKDRKALKKLTQDEKRRAAKGWDDKEMKRQIGQFEQITAGTGDKQALLDVKALTPGQFRALWTGTNFVEEMSTKYEVAQLVIAGRDRPADRQIVDDAFASAKALIEWAKKLDL